MTLRNLLFCFFMVMIDVYKRQTHLGALVRLRLLAESLQIFVDYLVGIEAFLGDLDVEVRDGLESFLLDIAHHGRLVHVDLPVLEAALQHLFGEFHGPVSYTHLMEEFYSSSLFFR